MLQCKFISSTFTEATFVSLSLRQFKFCVSGIVASSSLPEIARCWRGERNAVPLNKDEFCALGNRLKVDGSVLGLFSARRVSASVQPSWTHQTLSCRVPATSQLFCCCSPPPPLFLEAYLPCHASRSSASAKMCFSFFFFFFGNISPGGSSVKTRLLPFGASLDLLVWTHPLLQRDERLLRDLNCGCLPGRGEHRRGEGSAWGFANVRFESWRLWRGNFHCSRWWTHDYREHLVTHMCHTDTVEYCDIMFSYAVSIITNTVV